MHKQKVVIFSFVFMAAVLLVGCETTKGVATGIGCTAEGVVKDTKGAVHGIAKADEWVKKNMW